MSKPTLITRASTSWPEIGESIIIRAPLHYGGFGDIEGLVWDQEWADSIDDQDSFKLIGSYWWLLAKDMYELPGDE